MNGWALAYTITGGMIVGGFVLLLIASMAANVIYPDDLIHRRDAEGWINLARFLAVVIVAGIVGAIIVAVVQLFAWLVTLLM